MNSNIGFSSPTAFENFFDEKSKQSKSKDRKQKKHASTSQNVEITVGGTQVETSGLLRTQACKTSTYFSKFLLR
jgi:hypothetical protein